VTVVAMIPPQFRTTVTPAMPVSLAGSKTPSPSSSQKTRSPSAWAPTSVHHKHAPRRTDPARKTVLRIVAREASTLPRAFSRNHALADKEKESAAAPAIQR
jgi:hypothetical protein